MSRTHRSLLILTIALAAVIASAVLPVLADQPSAGPAPKQDPLISLDLKDIEVKAAVEALFRNSGRNFSLESNVDGVIPALSFKDVPFDTALKNLTRSAGLVYRKDGDVYLISKRVAITTTDPMAAPPPPTMPDEPKEAPVTRIEKVSLNYSSPSEILAMMKGGGRQYSGSMGNGGYGGGYGGYGNMGGMGGFGNMNGFGGMSNYGGFGGYGQTSGFGGYNSSGYGSTFNRGW